jgi:hypothetical protein
VEHRQTFESIKHHQIAPKYLYLHTYF